VQLRNVLWKRLILKGSNYWHNVVSTVLSDLVGCDDKAASPVGLGVNHPFLSEQHESIDLSMVKQEERALGPKHLEVLIMLAKSLHEFQVSRFLKPVFLRACHVDRLNFHMHKVDQIFLLLGWKPVDSKALLTLVKVKNKHVQRSLSKAEFVENSQMVERVQRLVALGPFKFAEVNNHLFISFALGFKFVAGQRRQVEIRVLKDHLAEVVHGLLRGCAFLVERVEGDGLAEKVHHDVGVLDLLGLDQVSFHIWLAVVALSKPDSARAFKASIDATLHLLTIRDDRVPENLLAFFDERCILFVCVEVVHDNEIVGEQLLVHLDFLVHFEDVGASQWVVAEFKLSCSAEIEVDAMLLLDFFCGLLLTFDESFVSCVLRVVLAGDLINVLASW
jgi:hypothetical protein